MDKSALMFRLTAISLLLFGCVAGQLTSDNTPPVFSTLDRDWEIPSNETLGSIVVRAKVSDAEGDHIEFGLEQSDTFGIFPGEIPFTIDHSGVVTVNGSLENLAGNVYSLYVTASDGKLSAKSQVRVRILAPGEKSASSGHPGHGAPPGFPVIPYHPATPRPPRRKSSTTTSTTTTSSTTTAAPEPSTQSPTSVPVSPITGEDNTTSAAPPPSASSPDFATTVVPAIAVGALLALAAGAAAWLFRRRLCKRAEGKEDLRKESTVSMPMQTQPALQHWRGPRAGHNRYESWEREANLGTTEGPALTPSPVAEKPATDVWEFPRHRLRVFHKIGEGCFGQVWKCEALDIDGQKGPTTVAVKTLKEHAGNTERQDLQQELRVMKMLQPHPNVVRLLGCCTEKDPLFVIMEYAAHGKLQSFLRNSRAERHYGNLHGSSDSLTSYELTSFMHQVARGMEYLSSRGIVHRDLAARNVLLTDDRTCKVADFGFARDIAASLVYERKSDGRLPIRWMAPESLFDNIFSAKSDVWSFGIFMWEVVTLGSTPYPGQAAAEVLKGLRDGLRLDKPDHCRREIYNIMYYCWDKTPSERPTFTEIVQYLERLLTSETDYIELERFPDHSYYNMVSLSGEKL